MKKKILLFLFIGSLLQAQVRIRSVELISSLYPAVSFPRGVAVDASGNVFVSYWGSGESGIVKITPKGVPTLAWSAGEDVPYGIVFDASGNLFVACEHANIIKKITSEGVVSTFAGTGTAGSVDGPGDSAEFSSPAGLAIDAAGNLYVADFGNHKIRKITPSGEVSTIAGSTQGYANGPGSAAKFDSPAGVAVDGAGNLYVADFGNHKIRKITTLGEVSTLAGSIEGRSDGPGASARFMYPVGVAVDQSGYVYAVDSNDDIRKISPEGYVLTYTTLDKTNDSRLQPGYNGYSGLAFDASGNLFVTDARFDRVLKVISTVCDLKASVSFTNVSCRGAANGTASVSVSGGSGVYSYLWSVASSANKKDISGLKSGNYTCKVTDSNGCEATAEFIITEPAENVTFANIPLEDYDYGVAYKGSVIASGGTGKISYSVTDGILPDGLSLSADGLITGTSFQASQSSFTVTGSDENGCSARYDFVLRPSRIVIKVTVLASQGKKFGEKDPVIRYTVSPDLHAGDSFTGELTRIPGESPGVYAIGLGTLSAGPKYLIEMQAVLFTIRKADQTITWGQNPAFGCDGEDSAVLVASSDSNLDILYTSSDNDRAAVINGRLIFKGYGSVAITASQPGDSNYNAAEPVTIAFTRTQSNLIRKQFSNVIFFDNSSKEFKSYTWYKNGVLVSGQTSQYFKENGTLNGVYYAVAQKNDGSFLTTCTLNLSGAEEEYVKIVPNPVVPGSDYELVTNMPGSRLKDAHVEVYNTAGSLVENKTADGIKSNVILKAPYSIGVYIVKITLSDGKYFTKNLLVGN